MVIGRRALPGTGRLRPLEHERPYLVFEAAVWREALVPVGVGEEAAVEHEVHVERHAVLVPEGHQSAHRRASTLRPKTSKSRVRSWLTLSSPVSITRSARSAAAHEPPLVGDRVLHAPGCQRDGAVGFPRTAGPARRRPRRGTAPGPGFDRARSGSQGWAGRPRGRPRPGRYEGHLLHPPTRAVHQSATRAISAEGLLSMTNQPSPRAPQPRSTGPRRTCLSPRGSPPFGPPLLIRSACRSGGWGQRAVPWQVATAGQEASHLPAGSTTFTGHSHHQLRIGSRCAASSSSAAARTPGGCRSATAVLPAWARGRGPRPTALTVIRFPRRSRWYVMAKRWASSRAAGGGTGASEPRGIAGSARGPRTVNLLEALGQRGDGDSSLSPAPRGPDPDAELALARRRGAGAGAGRRSAGPAPWSSGRRLPWGRPLGALLEQGVHPAGQHLLHRRVVVVPRPPRPGSAGSRTSSRARPRRRPSSPT